ncbi:MAG TPA: Spx/MgsR family RNA polymerase-binding regulatory protein [Pyrinomonadaceae bacterium]|nr:Spx/MgsR family RNA polymerase-binding regulatory protein [Pyrinomonadaceae bacterium]
MSEIKLYWLPHCSTCKKSKDFIEKKGLTITEFHDIKENRLSREVIEKLAGLVGGAENLFSRRAIKYREMGLHERELSIAEMIDLMSSEYTFIKRPVLVVDEKATAGFSEKIYNEILEK